jgi:hypothetical protein
MSNFSLAIATPSHYGKFCTEYLLSVIGLLNDCRDKDIEAELLVNTGISGIGHVRSILANRFLWQTDCTHMLFVDDDMGFDVQDMVHMFQWRDHDVIGVMSPKKSFDWKRVKEAVLSNPDIDPEMLPRLAGNYSGMFKLVDESRMTVARQPVPVVAIGTGLMMISRRCLMNLIEKANLPTMAAASGQPDDHPVYEFFRSTSSNGKRVGEDYYFCSLVNRHGGAIYGCPWVRVAHVGECVYVGDLPSIGRYM